MSIIITTVLIFDKLAHVRCEPEPRSLTFTLRSYILNGVPYMGTRNMPRPKPSAPQWQPGQSGNPKGRPLGSRNKLNEKFILALHDDFEKHGPAVIAEVREKRPEMYLKVIASVLPRELHFKSANAFDGISDEELDHTLESIRRILAARAPISHPAGEPATGGGDKPDRVH